MGRGEQRETPRPLGDGGIHVEINQSPNAAKSVGSCAAFALSNDYKRIMVSSRPPINYQKEMAREKA